MEKREFTNKFYMMLPIYNKNRVIISYLLFFTQFIMKIYSPYPIRHDIAHIRVHQRGPIGGREGALIAIGAGA